MSKLVRINKLHKLVKLQEQSVLAEFKQIQELNAALKSQINDLSEHSKLSADKIMLRPLTSGELNVARKFNGRMEFVLEQLNQQLQDNTEKYVNIADKVKDVRSRITSIERLADKEQAKQRYSELKSSQQQIDENINFTSRVTE